MTGRGDVVGMTGRGDVVGMTGRGDVGGDDSSWGGPRDYFAKAATYGVSAWLSGLDRRCEMPGDEPE